MNIRRPTTNVSGPESRVPSPTQSRVPGPESRETVDSGPGTRNSGLRTRVERRSTRSLPHRLKRNVGAMVGLSILLAILLLAIFAELLMPYDPLKPDPINALEPP